MFRSNAFAKAFVLALIPTIFSGQVLAQGNGSNNEHYNGPNTNVGVNSQSGSAIQLAFNAAGVLEGQRRQAPSAQIPKSLINGAHCIAVFPAIFKEGLIVAGKNGNGVAGCRKSDGQWGSPAYFSLSAGSLGFQAGAKTTEVIMLFMNKSAVDQLTNGNWKVGAKAAATVGPVGAHVSVHTAPAPIITYRLQSSGGFAGAEFKGAKISVDKGLNRAIYGNYGTTKTLLLHQSKVPNEISVFNTALQQYAPSTHFNANMKVKNNSNGKNSS